MSEHIVHTGILEDSAAIAQYLPQLSDDFKRVLHNYTAFAQLGCITVSGDTYSFRLMEEYRAQWQSRTPLTEAKLAFVLGWVSHRACDREMKPIWNIAEIMHGSSDADPRISPTECSVYHEAAMYNRYYKQDPTFRLAIFPDELAEQPTAGLLNLDRAAEFVENSFGTNMMEIQTFAGAADSSGQKFMENVCLRAQKFYVDVSRYTRAAASPDPQLLAEYVTDINWYSTNDAILAIAQQLRAGGTSTPEACKSALETPAQSHYGKALQLSLGYIITASDYFADPAMPMEVLKDRLDIGKKGPGGLGV